MLFGTEVELSRNGSGAFVERVFHETDLIHGKKLSEFVRLLHGVDDILDLTEALPYGLVFDESHRVDPEAAVFHADQVFVQFVYAVRRLSGGSKHPRILSESR